MVKVQCWTLLSTWRRRLAKQVHQIASLLNHAWKNREIQESQDGVVFSPILMDNEHPYPASSAPLCDSRIPHVLFQPGGQRSSVLCLVRLRGFFRKVWIWKCPQVAEAIRKEVNNGEHNLETLHRVHFTRGFAPPLC